MKQRYFHHTEELLELWPDVQKDDGKGHGGGVQAWWKQGPKRSAKAQYEGRGFGVFFMHSPRNQRAIVHAIITKSTAGKPWALHGAYVQRTGAQEAGKEGQGFDSEHEKVDIKAKLAQWQHEKDPHYFKLMLSPEQGKELDLKAYTRRVMRDVERDLKTPLEWAGIDHHNTQQDHVHVVVRGISEGQVLRIDRLYLHGGIKERAQETATHMLGPRMRHEIEQGWEHALTRKTWTELDQSIRAKMSLDRTVEHERLSPFEQRRIEQLHKRGYAFQQGESWRMASTWNTKEVGHERQAQTQEHEQKVPVTTHEQHHEQEHEQQQRVVIMVDEIEQGLGWGQ